MNYEKLTHQQEKRLILAGQAGDTAARNRVILTVEALAHHISYKLMRRSHDGLLNRRDMVHSSLALLCEKFHEYDITKGSRFITWAHWWIVRGCQLYAAQALHRGVRVPTFWRSKELEQMPKTVYLSELILTTDTAWNDIHTEHRPEDHEHHADEEERQAQASQIHYYLSQLDRRTAAIIYDHHAGKTFRQLAKEFGVCKERIRQLLVRGMGKLRKIAQADQGRSRRPQVRASISTGPAMVKTEQAYQLAERLGGLGHLAAAVDHLLELQD